MDSSGSAEAAAGPQTGASTPPGETAFDILTLEGQDLRQVPLSERKRHLTRVMPTIDCCLRLVEPGRSTEGWRYGGLAPATDTGAVGARRPTGDSARTGGLSL